MRLDADSPGDTFVFPFGANVIALTVAQSASMKYYERLERHGTVPMRVRPLHRFLGEAVATRAFG